MTQVMAQSGTSETASPLESQLSKGKVGMSCLIITECFFFVSFIVAYLYYIVILQVDDGGPTPEELFRSGLDGLHRVDLPSEQFGHRGVRLHARLPRVHRTSSGHGCS